MERPSGPPNEVIMATGKACAAWSSWPQGAAAYRCVWWSGVGCWR